MLCEDKIHNGIVRHISQLLQNNTEYTRALLAINGQEMQALFGDLEHLSISEYDVPTIAEVLIQLREQHS